MTAQTAAWLVIGLVLLLVGTWLLTRHIHRWTAWSDPEFDTWGHSFQQKRCKDRACNKYKRRDCGL